MFGITQSVEFVYFQVLDCDRRIPVDGLQRGLALTRGQTGNHFADLKDLDI